MGAPAKFLFDVDFASGTDRKPGSATITLAEHTIKLAEAEASASLIVCSVSVIVAPPGLRLVPEAKSTSNRNFAGALMS